MAPTPRIGTTIRRAMERKRMNQKQLAEALGVSRSAVNAWINDRAWPQGSIGALEELLEVSFDGAPPDPGPGLVVLSPANQAALRRELGDDALQEIIDLLERRQRERE